VEEEEEEEVEEVAVVVEQSTGRGNLLSATLAA
jgi:hypothetical protein